MRVSEEALAQGQRIDFEGQTVNERVPAMGDPGLDGVQIALDHSGIAQGAELLELATAYAPAGFSEALQPGLGSERLIQRDQLAEFMRGGVPMSGVDGGQFQREQ